MPQRVRNNALTIAMMALFALSYAGMAVSGYLNYNSDRKDRGRPPVSVTQYFQRGDFWEGTFENWESEFLQMGIFVILTAFLIQKGASESKDPEGDNPSERPPDPRRKGAPGPVRRGGLALRLYENSLSAALLGLFLLCFVMHAIGGAKAYNEEQADRGLPPVSALRFAGTSAFWYQSLQNWQSEFLSIAALGVLSIYLRQKGSPQSKPVDAAHDETGA